MKYQPLLLILHAVRVVQRRMPRYSAISPSGEKNFHGAILDEILDERVVSSRNRINLGNPVDPEHRSGLIPNTIPVIANSVPV